MINHVVIWTLKEEYNGQTKNEIAKELKKRLLALTNKIPQIKSFKVGINEVNFEKNHDVILLSEFDSFDDLQVYIKHPAHVEIGKFVKEITTGRSSVDYTID